MRIKIDAVDTLFFKDGKPFNMGDETWADGMFPPPLSVVSGALRTAWFSFHPEELPKAGGADDPTAALKINGIAMMSGGMVYYPAPLDMVLDISPAQVNKKRLEPLELTEPAGLVSSPFNKVLAFPGEGKIESSQGLLVDRMSLSGWQSGKKGKVPFIAQSDLVVTEAKTGIGRENRSRSVAEGKLYRVGMKRPVNRTGGIESALSILIDFDGVELPPAGYFKLGGEGKVARWSECDEQIIPTLPDISPGSGDLILKLYLLTPGIFPDGSKPPLPFDGDLELVAASTGKPLHLGGYDMKEGRPKPMKLAVPSGSVYYLKCGQKTANKIISLHGTSIAEEEYAKLGYGIVCAGVYHA